MLMRFDPFREMDRMLRQPWSGAGFTGMPLDAYRQGDEFVVEIDLPGVDPDSIDLTVEHNVLEVSAERAPRTGEGEGYLVRERPTGQFSRQLFLGQELDTGRVSASYDDGVLTIHIPVAEGAKPHRIPIAAGGQQEVEAGS